MVPTYGLWNLRPGKLNAADNLMTDGGMVGHLAEFLGIERPRLAKEAAVDSDFADVMQIPRAAQSRDFAGFHPHGLADCGGVPSYAQRVSVNVDMFNVDGGGEGLQSVVVETV